jgi:hypothetical protein
MIIRLILIGVVLFGGMVHAGQLKPDDFAQGIVLECPDNGSVCQFTLPVWVYDTLTRSDFRDVCVFNSKGAAVPFTLRHWEAKVSRMEETRPSVSLPIFPVYDEKRETGNGKMSWSIVADNSGALINLGGVDGGPGKKAGDKKPLCYLVDLSTLKITPQRLEFLWDNSSFNRVVRIEISESNDLDIWHALVSSAVLADVRFGNNHLQQKDISLSSFHSKYLKISGITANDRIVFNGITAHYESEKTEDAPREWVRVESRKDNENPLDYLFDLKGYLPVDRIRVVFSEKNTLINTVISSRNDHEKSWKILFQGLLYSLDVQGIAMEKNSVSFAPVADNRFKMTLDEHQMAPTMELGFIPHTVFFMAQGDGPYTLAYGSGKDEFGVSRENSMNTFLAVMDEGMKKNLVKDAVLVKKVDLGGEKQLKIQTKPSYRTIVLWIILLSAVLLCGYMAHSLYRQMASDSERGNGT